MGILKPHDLSFCFLAAASIPEETLVLHPLHRLFPLAQGFLCIEVQKGILMCFLIQGMFYHCPILFSRSTDFSAPLQVIASFGVRVYVSIVAGGYVTTYILAHSLTRRDLVLPFLPSLHKVRGRGIQGG